jgi:hypothetical protein
MADSSPGSAGSANTGNGGDGGGNPNSGSNGGSGIVIVKELSKASGVWSMNEQLEEKKAGTWPNFGVDVSFLVIAGGGGGGRGGGGAGGYRNSFGS